jgi:hypothetical protein
MSNMTTTDLARLADHAAGMNDRWLFLFALAVLGSVALLVARYWVKQYERLQSEHHEVLASLMGRQMETQAELARVVAANSEALRAVSQEVRWCKERSLVLGGARE